MKILVVQDRLRSGGTERQSVFLANGFAAAGHPTTLVTFRPGGKLAGTVSAEVRRRELQPFDTRLDWFAPGLFRTVTHEQPDITLCMGRMANCWAHGIHHALLKVAPRAGVICTMRTGKPLPTWFRRSLRTCRHVVANSQEARDTLMKRYAVQAEKVSVIHNSIVFPSRIDRSAGRSQLRREHGATTTTTVLLCVAMFRPEKNQRGLIDIVAGLPPELEVQLWLAGDGQARAECEALVAQRGMASRVKFVGFHRDPSALYAAADFAVHASRSESLSNFVIEAQAQGLPAVVYEAQGMSECFIPDHTGWIIPRDDAKGFRQRLMLLMNEPAAARSARIEAAMTFARAAFDPERQLHAYLELFEELRRRAGA